MSKVKHPYFPKDLDLPHYKANTGSIAEILGVFFVPVGLLFVLLWVLNLKKPVSTRMKICWFTISGCIHMILEGYFSVFYASLAGHDTYLAQMWKEYGKGDSRYVFGETCIVGIESITAFIDGPLCILTALAYTTDSLSSYRYIFQILVSSFQLYGDSLFFFTEVFVDYKHSEYGHLLHFWFYFFFLNAIWIVIPLLCIFDAGWSLSKSQAQVDQLGKINKKKK